MNLKYGAPGFVFSVGLSPANAAAALAALGIMQAEPQRVAELRQRSGLFLALARERNLPVGSSKGVSAVPLIVGDTERCVALTNALFQRGIDVQLILYPAVRERSVRLRFINNTHTHAQIHWAVDVVNDEAAPAQRAIALERGGGTVTDTCNVLMVYPRFDAETFWNFAAACETGRRPLSGAAARPDHASPRCCRRPGTSGWSTATPRSSRRATSTGPTW